MTGEPFTTVIQKGRMHYKCRECPRQIWREGNDTGAQAHMDSAHPGVEINVDPTAGEVIYEIRLPVGPRWL